MGMYLEAYRKKARLTREQVAKRLGVQAPAVYKWENGLTDISVRNAKQLATLYGVTFDALSLDPDKLPTSANYETTVAVWSALHGIHATAGLHVRMDYERIDEAKEISSALAILQRLPPALRKHWLGVGEAYPASTISPTLRD